MSYFAKLTGEDLSRYLNKTKSVGLRKAYCYRQISDLTLNAEKCLHFLALLHGGQNSWQRNENYVTVNLCIQAESPRCDETICSTPVANSVLFGDQAVPTTTVNDRGL